MKSALQLLFACMLALTLTAPTRDADKIASVLPRLAAAMSPRAVAIAVIGDSPYGAAQIADFPNYVAHINADPQVERVVHVGDIKNGSTRCDDSHFAFIEDQFATFADPLVYTPGDNEWTDCHRSNNGKYDPLERLQAVRDVFFAEPFFTLGQTRRPVLSQSFMPDFRDIPENALWTQSSALLATVHVVGSRNGRDAWFGDDATDALFDEPTRRLAEVEHRTEAALAWIELSFDLASRLNTKGVVLLMQADTWPGGADDGFSEILQSVAAHAVSYGKPVLVVQGDTHAYKTDQPLLNGDAVHGIALSVPNLTRIVVQGQTTTEWLKLRIDPSSAAVFSWERIMR